MKEVRQLRTNIAKKRRNPQEISEPGRPRPREDVNLHLGDEDGPARYQVVLLIFRGIKPLLAAALLWRVLPKTPTVETPNLHGLDYKADVK